MYELSRVRARVRARFRARARARVRVRVRGRPYTAPTDQGQAFCMNGYPRTAPAGFCQWG